MRPTTAEMANSPIATKKISLAMSPAAPGIPPKPKSAATRATIRKVIAQPSMVVTSRILNDRLGADDNRTTPTLPYGSRNSRTPRSSRIRDESFDVTGPEPRLAFHVDRLLLGDRTMTRTVAFRASAIFVLLALAFGAVGLGSSAAAAEALCLIAGSVCALMLLFALATPAHAPVPVRVRGRRS